MRNDGGVRQINPTGKSVLIYGISVKPRNQKYFCFPEGKSGVCVWPSRPDSEGRRPSSRTLGGLRWTLVCAETTAWISVRQNRVVLAPVAGVKLSEKRKRERQRRSQPRTRLRGEHGISRKAIAQGRPGVHRCPVCSCALCFVQTAHGTAGAARTRSSLRPLLSRARKLPAKLGRNASREGELTFSCHRPA